MDIYKEIESILNWYYVNSDKVDNPGLFLDKRDKLSVLSYRVAQEQADYNEQFLLTEMKRKIFVAKHIEEAMKQALKPAFNRIESQALIAAEEILDEEKTNEALTKRCSLILNQINKVLDAMNQRVSYLRKERETSNNQNHV